MNHFKDFLIKLHTLDIRIRPLKKSDEEKSIKYYDISHESPFLNAAFKNELRELKEMAITDILNLPKEQIIFQLQRLNDIRELFDKFWYQFYHPRVPYKYDDPLDYVYGLKLNDIFISHRFSFMDQARANHEFVDDLESTVTFRQEILDSFEQAIAKIINWNKELNNSATIQLPTPKTKPTFKEEIANELFILVKEYFNEPDRKRLMNLLYSTDFAGEPMVFNGAGNQLADAFKQLFDANLIVGCNKVGLEKWIQQNFRCHDKGVVKRFTEKYLLDMISSNTKACQSPLFDVRKTTGGQFYLSPLSRNNRNSKR